MFPLVLLNVYLVLTYRPAQPGLRDVMALADVMTDAHDSHEREERHDLDRDGGDHAHL